MRLVVEQVVCIANAFGVHLHIRRALVGHEVVIVFVADFVTEHIHGFEQEPLGNFASILRVAHLGVFSAFGVGVAVERHHAVFAFHLPIVGAVGVLVMNDPGKESFGARSVPGLAVIDAFRKG